MIKHFTIIALMFLILLAYFPYWVYVSGFFVSVVAVFFDKYFMQARDPEKRLRDVEAKVDRLMIERGLNDLRRR